MYEGSNFSLLSPTLVIVFFKERHPSKYEIVEDLASKWLHTRYQLIALVQIFWTRGESEQEGGRGNKMTKAGKYYWLGKEWILVAF